MFPMQPAVSTMVMLWSVLVPARQWVPPSLPVEVTVKSARPLTLLLADFTGSTIAPTTSADVKDGQTVDLKRLYPSLTKPGTYLLVAVPTPKDVAMISAANVIGT